MRILKIGALDDKVGSGECVQRHGRLLFSPDFNNDFGSLVFRANFIEQSYLNEEKNKNKKEGEEKEKNLNQIQGLLFSRMREGKEILGAHAFS